MEQKIWYKSKTLWINLIALIGTIVGFWGFDAAQWTAISGSILAGINIILRLVTKEEIVWS